LAATNNAESVMAQVLAKHNIKSTAAPAAKAAPVAAPAQTNVEAADEKASQEKVKELA